VSDDEAPQESFSSNTSFANPYYPNTGVPVSIVPVQQRVAKLAKTAIEFPPMQAPASCNLEAVKAQIDEAIKNHAGQ
jgi:hypothetical protein